jgi:integrase
MTVYKRGNRWHAQVDLPDRGDGKRHRRAGTFPIEREAKQQEAQWVTERAAGTSVDPSRMTVGALLATWLETIEPNVKRKTFVAYEHTVHHHLIPALGHRKLQTLTSVNVHDAYTAKRKVNTGARTLQLMHLRLCQALDLAVNWQLVAKNVARLVETPSAPPKPHTVWTPEEQHRFLTAAADEHHHPIWHVLVTTGLRRGELLGLRWADLDLAGQCLRVEQQVVMVGTRLEITSVKTEKSRRRLGLPPSLVSMLLAHRERQLDRIERAGEVWEDHDLVFATGLGRPLAPRNVARAFKALCQRAGVPEITLHQGRHTHTTTLIAAGVPIGVVSQRLGHSKVSTTMDIYAHILPSMQEAATAAIETLFFGHSSSPDGEHSGVDPSAESASS